jgi:formate hydrogenlyase subunit 4
MTSIEIITQLLELIVALAAAPLFVGWINQCRAWLQNRSAPSLWLPYRGIRKLFHKDAVIATGASRLFRLAPYIIFGAMVVAAGIIPSMGTRLPLTQVADAIALVGLLATARVFMSLAAMDIGTAFGTLGARREMMVGFLAEPALLMVIMVLLAENARIPIDNPATHLELTMIHEATLLEYSARHLALMEWAAALTPARSLVVIRTIPPGKTGRYSSTPSSATSCPISRLSINRSTCPTVVTTFRTSARC